MEDEENVNRGVVDIANVVNLTDGQFIVAGSITPEAYLVPSKDYEALLADKNRLDWIEKFLEQNGLSAIRGPEYTHLTVAGTRNIRYTANSFREAVDQAMKDHNYWIAGPQRQEK
jgi:hypothetical protein